MKNKSLLLRGGIVLLLCFFFFGFTPNADQYYYYHKGEKIELNLNKKIINISVFRDFSKSELEKFGVKSFEFQKDVSQNKASDLRYAKIEFLNEPSSESEYFELIGSIKNLPGARTVYPSFFVKTGEEVGLSDYVYVKLKDLGDLDLLKAQVKNYSMELIEQHQYLKTWYTLRCTEKTPYSSLEVANKIFESRKFAAAIPDMLTYEDLLCTNDPLFNVLWGLSNTANTDINACQAWPISQGSGVVVALLDQGVQRNHSDLAANIYSQSFDTETGTSPSVVYGSHGTHCGGTIVAVKNNSLQVVGVAPSAKLMDISNYMVASANSRIHRTDGMIWAYKHGADIISNSWHDIVLFAPIEEAIDSALTYGRGGKGTIVVFAAGNSGASSVSYPGNSNSDVLSVGAIDVSGAKASFSQYGTGLDVVAPGVGVMSTIPGNLTDYKSGTSMACPHVAGVAALILSVKPCLTMKQVNQIIEKSARKIGNYSYVNTTGRPNGTWNTYMGYGIVDAHAAVLLAQNTTCGPVNACTSTITSFPYAESFESSFGAWTQETADNFDWTRQSGATGSTGTGPTSAADGIRYIYTESSSPNSPSKKAILNSPCFDLTGKSNMTLSFSYHMYGATMGNLKIEASINNGSTWTTIWTKSGNQGNSWKSASVSLNSYSNKVVRLRITGTTGSSFTSDMAVDKIKISGPVTACTSTITSFPYTESFETSFGTWTQDANDNFNWSRLSGSTPSTGTGPTSASDGKYYVFTESSSPNSPNKKAILNSPCFNLTGKYNMNLSFSYHMYGAAMGNLKIEASVNNGASWTTIWTKSGNQGNSWKTATVSLNAYSNKIVKLRITGTTGSTFTSDMAVDKINISQGTLPCSATITSFPYTESFETSFGTWTQDANDNFNWSRLSGSTPSNGTGPTSASDGKYYVFTESSSPNSPNKKAILNSPCFNLTGKYNMTLSFAYHMYGAAMGNLKIEASINNGASWTTIWTKSGNQGNSWKTATVSLNAYSNKIVKLRITGTTGSTFTSDMAVDKINIGQAALPCSATITNFPYRESFETGYGAWTQSTADNFNWSRTSGTTPSTGTGPTSAAHGTQYIFTESSSPNSPSKVAILNGPCLDMNNLALPVMHFSYHMYGSSMGKMEVQISTDGGYNWITLWTKSGNQGNAWKDALINLGNYTNKVVRLRIVGTTGSSFTSDMAVDDIFIGEPAQCGPTVITFPYTESFESNVCSWSQNTDDDFNWSIISGATPSTGTGPTSAYHGTKYAYTEASSYPNKTAILTGPCIDLRSQVGGNMSFAYHMYGSGMGKLSVEISTNGGISWTPLWSKTGNQGNAWRTASIYLGAYAGKIVRFRIVGQTGNSYLSDMAIDKIFFEILPTKTNPNNGSETAEAELTSEFESQGSIVDKPELKVYPNPANTFITVNYISEKSAQIQISVVDVSGRRLYTASADVSKGENETRIPLDQYSPGSYILLLDDGEGNSLNQKFIINR